MDMAGPAALHLLFLLLRTQTAAAPSAYPKFKTVPGLFRNGRSIATLQMHQCRGVLPERTRLHPASKSC